VPALIAGRRWRTLLWTALVAAGLSLASLLAFGEGAWGGFLAIGPLARAVLEFGGVGFAKMVSTFAAARLLDAGLTGAWAAQALVSLATLIVLLIVVHRKPGAMAEGAMLATAACLATPFLLDYDLLLLAIPLPGSPQRQSAAAICRGRS
jgi:alpha-1,2-mannosyltransferase